MEEGIKKASSHGFCNSIIQKSEVILCMHILIHLSFANSFKIAVTFFYRHKQDTRCKLRKHVQRHVCRYRLCFILRCGTSQTMPNSVENETDRSQCMNVLAVFVCVCISLC